MGHFSTIYGYIQIHLSDFDESLSYVEQQKLNQKFGAKFVCGHHINERSGFATLAICGELKEYHDDNPSEFIDSFYEFLEPIEGICCTLCFDSELGIYPPQLKYVRQDDTWLKDPE